MSEIMNERARRVAFVQNKEQLVAGAPRKTTRRSSVHSIGVPTRRRVFGAAALGVGATAVAASPAAAFTPGVTRPTASNVGPWSKTLKPHRGRIYADTPGQVIEGLDIEGDIVIRAPRVTVRNCRVRGMPGNAVSRGLVDCTHRKVWDARVEYCDLFVDVRWPNQMYTGVQGHHVRVYRCHIHDLVDGVGIMNPTVPTSTSCVIEGNLIENLTYFTPSISHDDGRTHNDCIQHQGGSKDIIRGNYLSANPSVVGFGLKMGAGLVPNEFAADNSVPGQCMAITPVLAPVTNCQIIDNWMIYGAQSMNVIPGKHPGSNVGHIRRNRFMGGNPATFLNGSLQSRAVVLTPEMSAVGIRSNTGLDRTSGNVDRYGKPITIWRLKLS